MSRRESWFSAPGSQRRRAAIARASNRSNREAGAEAAAAGSTILPCSSACRLAGGLAEEVAWDVDQRKTSSFFSVRFKICLHKNLDGFLAGVNFDGCLYGLVRNPACQK